MATQNTDKRPVLTPEQVEQKRFEAAAKLALVMNVKALRELAYR